MADRRRRTLPGIGTQAGSSYNQAGGIVQPISREDLLHMTTLVLIPQTLAIFGLPGGSEWIILLVLGLLVFGRRLPEVGRNMARSIVEFKKGLRNIENEVDDASHDTYRSNQRLQDSPPRDLPVDSRSPQREPADRPYAGAERVENRD
jgi:sec-independent protein translocase protein TatA